MMRFRWPLQRLLDVTVQREAALRQELLALSRQMARLRQEIFDRQDMLSTQVAALGLLELPQRIARQEVFLRHAERTQREIECFQAELAAAREQRTKTTRTFIRTRTKRQTLERLREDARVEHLRKQVAEEQKRFDEGFHVAFARKAIRRQHDGVER
jgi:flagellar biosynthesis chaperone FliJ